MWLIKIDSARIDSIGTNVDTKDIVTIQIFSQLQVSLICILIRSLSQGTYAKTFLLLLVLRLK